MAICSEACSPLCSSVRGPGALCVTVVLAVQALLFADGGLSALGLNVINMAMIGAFAGYAIFVAIRTVLPTTRSGIVVASGLAAFVAPILAAIAFTFEYAIGGNDAVSVSTVGWAMIGVHALIGIGEGIITALTISAVMSSRPDLVYGARNLTSDPVPAGEPVAV